MIGRSNEFMAGFECLDSVLCLPSFPEQAFLLKMRMFWCPRPTLTNKRSCFSMIEITIEHLKWDLHVQEVHFKFHLI